MKELGAWLGMICGFCFLEFFCPSFNVMDANLSGGLLSIPTLPAVTTVIVVFCLSLMVAGLFGWNFWLVSKNETSQENYDKEVQAARAKKRVCFEHHVALCQVILLVDLLHVVVCR